MKKMILFTFLLMILLSGCKDYVEIQNLAIATAIGVDVDTQNPDWYDVSIEIVQFDQDTPKAIVISGNGQTYLEAVTNATKHLGNQLYFSHAQVIVLSEQVANDGIYPFVDAIYRNSDLRLDIAILVAKDVSAIDVLSAKSEIEEIAGIQIKKILDSNHIISEIPQIPAYEFINNITSNGVCGAVSVIKLSENNTREVDGLAIFKDGTVFGYLDKKQTKTLSFLQNKTKIGRVINEYDEKTPTYNLESSKADISVEIVDGKFLFDFKVDMKIELSELSIAQNTIDYGVLQQMESEISSAVMKDFNDLILYQIENAKADFIGLGDVVYRKYPKIWQNISDNFDVYIENLEYSLDVSCEIVGTGLVSSRLNLDV